MIQKRTCTVHELKPGGIKGELLSEVTIYHTNVLAAIATWMMTPVHLAQAWLKTLAGHSHGGEMAQMHFTSINESRYLKLINCRHAAVPQHGKVFSHGMLWLDTTNRACKVWCQAHQGWHVEAAITDECNLNSVKGLMQSDFTGL